MEQLLEFLQGVDWRVVGEVVVALVTVYIAIKKGKTTRALKAVVTLAQTAYSAVEEADADGNETAKKIKTIVDDTVTDMTAEIPNLREVEKVIMTTVDPKEVDGSVPPIKRFWRRFLAGDNAAGVLARIVGRAAVGRAVEEVKDRIEG